MRFNLIAIHLLFGTVACAAAPAPTPAPPAPTPAAASAQVPPPSPPPSFSGIWLGTLHAGDKSLRLQLHLDLAQTPPACSLDSLDQRAYAIPCDVTATSPSLTIDVPSVQGSLVGTASDDGNTVHATWKQKTSLPLDLTRQATAIEPPKAPMEPAMSPVAIADLQGVLDKDLAEAIASGDLAPSTGAGIAIGVVSHGIRRILSYGAVKPDSVFEIGSISKTFTGLLLAQMVAQKKARLDEPVRALLPPGVVAAPASGAEITLLDLSTHRSGLPRLPDNLKPADPDDPYADYDEKALFAFVASHGLAAPTKPQFSYSNLGVGLLGDVLARRAGSTYETLLRREITGPLGMRDTAVTLTPSMTARFAPGHDGDHKPAKAWRFDALVGCGGIRSTVGDMLTYLEAQLHPDHLPSTAHATAEGRTLATAIVASHELQGPDRDIALNWGHDNATGDFGHDGATGGYGARVIFNVEKDFGVVVLSNTSEGGARFFAADVGEHVEQRLTGQPAISLGPLNR